MSDASGATSMPGVSLRGLLVNGSLVLLAAATLFPLAWMVSASLMATGEASSHPPPLVPHAPTLEHYRRILGAGGEGAASQSLARPALNSLAVATAATLLSLAFNLSAGYAFAKLRFAGRERIFRALLSALVVPGQVAMLPLFLLLKQMGLVNTYGGALVPWLAGVFGIFLVRQYARGIPDDILEAARIDGAGEARIFVTIVLPLLRPIVVTLAVLVFLGAWNDFMWPLIVLTDRELQTLPVALAGLSREHVQETELMMAGAVLTTLPVIVLFLVLQRHYMSGLLAGSVK